MPSRSRLKSEIFRINSEKKFQTLALEVFRYQYANNSLYQTFCQHLYIHPDKVKKIEQIPFLPVSFFRNFKVLTGQPNIRTVFASSGTTGQATSHHHITDIQLYEHSFTKGFERFYGKPDQYCILALLPSYLERQQSSLVYMTEHLIRQSGHPNSGFYLYEHEKLFQALVALKASLQPTILLGVTYALLDMAAAFPLEFPELIVMETGGMKGKRREMVREEVHNMLCKGFGVKKIHSEYGMTELLSQAYSNGNGLFASPPWMRVLIRDTNDPLKILEAEKSGGINVIDLANIDSCAFLELQDLGKMHPNGLFEVLGRFDYSQVRGCNLLLGSSSI